jgi:hypothetical protein
MNKYLKVIAALPLGFITGFLAAFLHQANFKIWITWYWGFLFAIIFIIVMLRFSVNLAKSKLASILFIPGWLAATLLLSTVSASGDIVLANDLITKVYLALSVILMGVAAVWPTKN